MSTCMIEAQLVIGHWLSTEWLEVTSVSTCMIEAQLVIGHWLSTEWLEVT